MTEAGRLERTAAADALCRRAFADATCPDRGVALVAVGGYGRRELAPYSDLDLVLVHDAAIEPGPWAARLWYPLWDSGHAVDHAVRSPDEVVAVVAADLRAALSVLDLRHLVGDAALSRRLRSDVLGKWRREARARLGELRALADSRTALVGELAHAAVPDVKESTGGLRDATVLRALATAWLADVPHAELEDCRRHLLDARDALHQVSGRRGDRVAPEVWPDLADRLGFADGVVAQRHVRGVGRRITALSRRAWRRVGVVPRRPTTSGVRRPPLVRLGNGVAVVDGEVVLAAAPSPSADTGLLLACAAEAAERGLMLSPATAALLVRGAAPLAEPWPGHARELFVRILGAGPGLPRVWEVLDESGALDGLLPEWERVRLLPHASAVHRFTVDRHLVQTCVEAATLAGRTTRPDLLLVAALMHDIGKGDHGDHSDAGAPVAEDVARRIGFCEQDAARVGRLVRHHLLLSEAATAHDPADPTTVCRVTAVVGDREELRLLSALTEADARATGGQAWTRWRAALVDRLVEQCAAVLP